jgi:lipoprotein-releasing system ATP-binding protein
MDPLALKYVSKIYGTKETSLTILENVNFTLKKGEVVALVAPSGTGKSTLLHLAGLLDSPTQGDIIIQGQSSQTLNDTQKADIRNKDIGFVYQQHHLLPEFDCLENIMMPMLVANKPLKEARDFAYHLLQKVNLEKRSKHRPSQLSGGEQQRVSFLRALSNKPSILLADEPTGNLDAETGKLVFEELLRIVKDTNLSCLIATHNQDLAKQMDRIITIQNKCCIELN